MPSAGWGPGAGQLFVAILPSTDRCTKRLRPCFCKPLWGEAVLALEARQQHEVVSWPSLAGDTSFHLLWWRHHLF